MKSLFSEAALPGAEMLVFSEEEVRELLGIEEVMEAVERAVAALTAGRAKMPPRGKVEVEGLGDFLSMAALVEDLGIYVSKIISIYPGNPAKGLPTSSAALLAFDPSTGTPLALVSARYLTAMRTGAICGIATKYLAREDACRLAVIGCGFQARTQALAISKVRKLDGVRVYDIVEERARRYSEEIGGALGVKVEVAGSVEEAVRGADIIVTATTSKEPVLSRRWVGDGTHINAIGSYSPDVRELDTDIIIGSKVVVDSREAALEEAGDIIIPIKEGLFAPERIHAELGEIILGKKPGRVSPEEITVFKTVGLAVQDAAAAHALLKKLAEKLKG